MNLFQDFLSSDKKPWERNSLKGPGLRARSLKNSPGVFSAFALSRRKCFPTGRFFGTLTLSRHFLWKWLYRVAFVFEV